MLLQTLSEKKKGENRKLQFWTNLEVSSWKIQSAYRQSAVYAVVTFISYPCGDFKGSGH